MRRYLAILAAATFIGCTGQKDNDDTGGDNGDAPGDDDDAACANSVIATFPEADDADVYYKTDVRFSLAVADPAASIRVTDAGGTEISGTTTVDTALVSWDGSADLSPTTTYTATLTYECGEVPISFTTSSTGAPTTVPIDNLVYDLDLTSGEWVKPAGVGDLLATQLTGVQVLVSPTTVTATTITMLGALGDESLTGVQDMCSPSLDFGEDAAWTDPYFELQSPQLILDVAGFVVTVDDLLLSGAFAPDGSRIQGAVLKGRTDTRPLVDLIVPGGEPSAVCDLVATFGVPCEPCSDGSGDYCLSVHVDNIVASQIPGAAPLVIVSDADIAANPDCGGTTGGTP